MALQVALDFIERVRRDSAFRREACAANRSGGFATWRKTAGYAFRSPEIWDAFRSMLLKCPDEETAFEVKELRIWYTLLSGETEEGGSCGDCSLQGSCSGTCP